MPPDDPGEGDSQERAIFHFQRAREKFTPAAYFLEWLDTTYDLALLYERRVRGGQAENIDRAIKFHEEIILAYPSRPPPTDQAASHMALARLYLRRLIGNHARNVETAIKYCQQALEVWTRDEHIVEWAEAQDLLGTLCRRRLRGDPAKNLEDSLGHHQAALGALEPIHRSCAEDWARVHHNLGTALLHRISGDRGDNLEEAIVHFEKALDVRARDASPTEWADTQSNLAIAYVERQREDWAQNVEHAIELLEEVFSVHQRETFPAEWAVDQSILGNALLRRIYGERAENIERAIECYEQALNEQDWGAHTEERATTQHNLAVAYSERLLGDRVENLKRAVEYNRAALERVDRRAVIKWALFKTDMVDILWKLANLERQRDMEQAAAALKEAIDHGEEVVSALEGQPPSHRWALAQYNLGNAYGDRIRGNRVDNQEKAIAHYNRALDFYTDRNYPIRWAETHNNLGVSYWERIAGDRVSNLEQAVQHFNTTLDFCTPDALPAGARRAARNLGNLHFGERDWEEAHMAYAKAIQAGDALLEAAYTEAGRRVEVGEISRLYARAAYALLQLEQPAEAFLRLEHGRTRLLAEALALGDADLAALPATQRQAMREARQAVRRIEAEMRSPPDTSVRRSGRESAEALRQARTHLTQLIADVRDERPAFMPTGLGLPEIMDLIPAGGALVAPLLTSQGSAVFVLPPGAKTVRAEHVFPLKAFTEDTLSSMLVGSEYKPGWLRTYVTYLEKRQRAREVSRALNEGQASPEERKVAVEARRTALENWMAAIEAFTGQLWDALMGPVHERLVTLGLAERAPVTLMPQGGLSLLPLHAAWRCVGGAKRAFLDNYTVTYAPSAYALSVSRRRLQDECRHQSRLLAVVNPTLDLPYASIEGELIAALFPAARRRALSESDATLGAVVEAAQGCTHLHLACHGFYDWHDVMHSGLVLTTGVSFTLAEIISKLDLNTARLVTLSACETGLTEFQQSPDEYIGLPAGFLQAGAPGVVSALWAVDDISTALLMGRFYCYHLGGTGCRQHSPLPPAQALRRAQRWLRDEVTARMATEFCLQRARQALRARDDQAYRLAQDAFMDYDLMAPDSRPFAHPMFWAPFIVSGQ